MQTLEPEQIAFYREHGYLRIPNVFTSEETSALKEELDWMIREWANIGVGWTGPWRQALMDIETEAKSKLIAMHDLQYYSNVWMMAVTKPSIANMMSQLLAGEDEPDGAPVELHHSTMHVKPPETGHPFPMHQDLAFLRPSGRPIRRRARPLSMTRSTPTAKSGSPPVHTKMARSNTSRRSSTIKAKPRAARPSCHGTSFRSKRQHQSPQRPATSSCSTSIPFTAVT